MCFNIIPKQDSTLSFSKAFRNYDRIGWSPRYHWNWAQDRCFGRLMKDKYISTKQTMNTASRSPWGFAKYWTTTGQWYAPSALETLYSNMEMKSDMILVFSRLTHPSKRSGPVVHRSSFMNK